ncbi:hypothetical protein E2I00_016149 [Balaenoptera physalus]|uniref:CIDE-N domain-containing protein n=1 Tax=Balaenoptera physalus TaxID=9770 RepID=A0A643BZR4_BALPH|nr:hypothetical protein E2I00_016149 [Balaenoptera physalus]
MTAVTPTHTISDFSGIPNATRYLNCSAGPLYKLPVPGSSLCLYEDGTELTGDYFWSVPDDSELVLLTAGQTWQGCKWRGPWRLVGKLGPFDVDDCASRHSINPYSNRESRVLFSTWNLDHVIEKKRTVVPTLAAAIHDAEGREVDWEYFYRLLFTSENLKLVHIACHKKTTHRLHCDPSRIYRAPAVPRRKRPARQRP